ncbi:MAG: phosphoribosyltransferase [Legionella sp.]|nr:phosphoribosyltransferase [Legionella sp.]
MDKFIDRKQAGILLAKALQSYADNTNVIALALPRGGVPVAFEIASALSIPLDVFIVRKLGVPWHKELAMGAISSGGGIFLNKTVIDDLKISASEIEDAIRDEKKELFRREALYRSNHAFPTVAGKIILLIDDGIATGSTMRAAVLALQQQKPAQIIIAVPVAEQSISNELSKLVDKMVCLLTPEDFIAVGMWYESFPQTSDEEVCELLKRNTLS